MELKRALELRTEYDGASGVIRVDKDDYICLNEMNDFFPNRRLDHWLKTDATNEFIACVERTYNLPPKGGIIAKRGKGGGTWAHPMIAFEFATWLSPEFKLKVYRDYIEGRQTKQDWNIKRILAANNYKLMQQAVHEAHAEPKTYHYTNEALMLNEVVFGVRDGAVRDNASEEQLDILSKLESYNAGYIEAGMDYQTRKQLLTSIFQKYGTKVIS